jgi:hypothetical protein
MKIRGLLLLVVAIFGLGMVGCRRAKDVSSDPLFKEAVSDRYELVADLFVCGCSDSTMPLYLAAEILSKVID